jgi:Flp pilus assembly protein TadG
MIGRLRAKLARDERGAAIIELAMVAPVLALMTIGVVDMSNAFSRKLALEQATQRAVEKVMQTTGDVTVEATIQGEAAAQAGVPASQVTVTHRMECNSVEMPDYNLSECAEGEIEGRYIIVTVTDGYEPMFPIHFGTLNADGKYAISATAGMRTQ